MTKARVGRPRGENVDNANRRRKQIIEAAIESIVEHGLSDTTLATIAKASDLSQGTVVFYFKNKESLLLEAFRYRMEEYRAIWMDALSSAGSDPIERLIALVFASLDPRVMTRQNLIFWNSFWSEASANPRVVEICDRFVSERQDVQLSVCEDAYELMSGTNWTPKTVAHTLETMTDGIWRPLYLSPDYMSVKDARMATGTLMSVIFPSRTEEIMKRASDCPDS